MDWGRHEGYVFTSRRYIWIVTYPKAGTTWTQQIVKLINNNGEDDDVNILKSVPWVEMFNDVYRYDLDSYPSPRAFKSHFPYHLMPCGLPSNTPGRYIYVARNPKDVAVSSYHHVQSMKGAPNVEWDQLFNSYISGEKTILIMFLAGGNTGMIPMSCL